MTSTTDLDVADEQLRRACLEELAAQGLRLPEGEQELVVALFVSAYREDLERAARASAAA
jgi:hypothetical protein